jgi:chemotaxis protein MotB
LLNQKLVDTQDNNEKLEKEIKTYKNPKTLGLTHFRSEFFAKLMKIVGERQDIRVVGDRFVFQSEVLFDKGSAEIRDEGKKQLKHLARILKEITSKIPSDIHWVLRIDGHTDKLPISQKFASNWELSSARAIAVVKQLIAEGIKAQNLVAAGFGEFHPLSNSKDETEMARNRRIEFKLDQR